MRQLTHQRAAVANATTSRFIIATPQWAARWKAALYLPAVLAVAAVAVLGIGWLPRAAPVVAWVVVAYCAVIALFADWFDIPGWAQRASPFAHTPRAPLDVLTPTPLVIIAAVAVTSPPAATPGYAGAT